MNLAGRFEWRWQRRDDAMPPRAVVGWGPVAERLHERLRQLPEERQARLLATASGDVIVVAGETADLPWVEGAGYAAPCEAAPTLWLPTLWRPEVPSELLARALERRHARRPLLLWAQPSAVIPLDRQLPVTAAHLARIAQHWHKAAA